MWGKQTAVRSGEWALMQRHRPMPGGYAISTLVNGARRRGEVVEGPAVMVFSGILECSTVFQGLKGADKRMQSE